MSAHTCTNLASVKQAAVAFGRSQRTQASEAWVRWELPIWGSGDPLRSPQWVPRPP